MIGIPRTTADNTTNYSRPYCTIWRKVLCHYCDAISIVMFQNQKCCNFHLLIQSILS